MADDYVTTETEGTPTKTNPPDVDPARAALVKVWQDRVLKAKKKYDAGPFKTMRENQKFAFRGADDSWGKEKYTVPVIVRYINQAVAQLYAKNPTAVAKKKPKMNYQLWDGKAETLQGAMQSVAPQPMADGSIMPPTMDPMAIAILQEVQGVMQQEQMIEKLGQTMEHLWTYFINEQAYSYKTQIKSAVRRAKVCKVAYAKLGYQRILEPNPEVMAHIEDATSKISMVQARLEAISEGQEYDETSAEMEELRQVIEQLQQEPELIAREGPVYDFPRADKIIIDPCCFHLKSFAGARWLGHEFEYTPEEIREIYEVDVSGSYTKMEKTTSDKDEKDSYGCRARIWEIQDKKLQQVFTICEGYPDYLREPAEPNVKLERFWTVFPLVFNECESDEELFPPSDIENAKHIQEEYNRSREALREHRVAARPWWAVGGAVEETEMKKIGNHSAHEVVQLKQLAAGGKIADVLQAGPTAPIDPNLYEVEMHFTDMMRVIGIQEASLGATAGGTATESSIAQQSQSTSLQDNIDDLDEWLTEIAKATGQLMLQEVQKDTVLEIVGPGAVWPDMPQSRSEVSKDLNLEIKAGSSGRPNRAAELANFERGMPLLLQVPGIKPEPLARKGLELLDIDVSLDDTIAEGMPSIQAMNQIVAKMAMGGGPGAAPTGDSSTDPNQQGAQGGNNAPSTQPGQPGPQPAYTPPAPIGVPS